MKETPENIQNILHDLAHDLRNPIGGIRGFAALLERDLADRPDLQRMASYIIKGTDDLNDVISKVLKKIEDSKRH